MSLAPLLLLLGFSVSAAWWIRNRPSSISVAPAHHTSGRGSPKHTAPNTACMQLSRKPCSLAVRRRDTQPTDHSVHACVRTEKKKLAHDAVATAPTDALTPSRPRACAHTIAALHAIANAPHEARTAAAVYHNERRQVQRCLAASHTLSDVPTKATQQGPLPREPGPVPLCQRQKPERPRGQRGPRRRCRRAAASSSERRARATAPTRSSEEAQEQ